MLRAMFIHGVGSEAEDFAKQSAEWLATTCPGLTAGYVWWAPIADREENTFWTRAKAAGMAGNHSQRISVFDAMDAFLWLEDPEIRGEVFDLCDRAYAKVYGSPTREVTIFGHSLGCEIAVEWLTARPDIENVRLVTLADNELVVRAYRKGLTVPAQLAGGNRWFNLYAPDDALGFPVAWSMGPAVRDVSVKLHGLLAQTGLAHIRYWGDRELWLHTIPALLAHDAGAARESA